MRSIINFAIFPVVFNSFGTLSQNNNLLGNFNQCLDSKHHIIGKYCQVQIRSTADRSNQGRHISELYRLLHLHPVLRQLLNWPVRKQNSTRIYQEFKQNIDFNLYQLGVCFPHTCNSADIEKILNKCIKMGDFNFIQFFKIYFLQF